MVKKHQTPEEKLQRAQARLARASAQVYRIKNRTTLAVAKRLKNLENDELLALASLPESDLIRAVKLAVGLASMDPEKRAVIASALAAQQAA